MFAFPTTRVVAAAIASLCAGGMTAAAQAQDATPWKEEPHGGARLIAGAARTSASGSWLRAGVEIRLDPGWETYWRYPGDSGVPPKLDFAGSQNVKSVTTLWPAPRRLSDGAGGHSIGYVGDVVWPLRIVPKNAAKPTLLHVKLAYAICGKLCMPAEVDLDLPLSGNVGREEPALAAAEARVPQRTPLGRAAEDGLAIRSVHREAVGGRERVVIDVAAPKNEAVDLFVEGPTADWALPLPEPEKPPPDTAPNVRRFSFDVDGVPPGAREKGATLTLTAVSPADAIEVEAGLD